MNATQMTQRDGSTLDGATLDGATRATILLLSLEEESALRLIEHLDENELRLVRQTVGELNRVDAELIAHVHHQFVHAYRAGLASMASGDTYLRELVARAHGEEAELATRGDGSQPEEQDHEPASPLASLEGSDPEMLALVLASEHPQVVAAVLAHVDPATAAVVLQRQSDERQVDLMRRVTKLRAVPSSALADIEAVVGSLGLGATEGGTIDGVASVAAILNQLGDEDATQLLERLAEFEPEQAVELKRAMFTFESLIDADTKGLQALLREVASESLMVALKTASEELKGKLLACMSSRAAAMMLEELDVMPPVPLTRVEQAQQEIAEQAMQLISDGRLVVAGRGEEMV
ncbi:MAG: hypothetical protein KC503_29295 [Myxococcales bacterium]|nr:hypothetical protein [Myxococcales bacterium]